MSLASGLGAAPGYRALRSARTTGDGATVMPAFLATVSPTLMALFNQEMPHSAPSAFPEILMLDPHGSAGGLQGARRRCRWCCRTPGNVPHDAPCSNEEIRHLCEAICLISSPPRSDEQCAVGCEFRLCCGDNLADRYDVQCNSAKRQQRDSSSVTNSQKN